jgi:cobalt/nickel transport protein
MKKTRNKVIVLLLIACLIALVPLFSLKGAEFSGSDDAGSQMVDHITGGDYHPWFTPVLETLIGGELPGEIESLLFCVQTGIGVGIIAFLMGRLVERKKHENKVVLEIDKKVTNGKSNNGNGF